MDTERIVVEFPPETTKIIDDLAKRLQLSRVEIISRGIGLLQLWSDAHDNRGIVVERPIDWLERFFGAPKKVDENSGESEISVEAPAIR